MVALFLAAENEAKSLSQLSDVTDPLLGPDVLYSNQSVLYVEVASFQRALVTVISPFNVVNYPKSKSVLLLLKTRVVQ